MERQVRHLSDIPSRRKFGSKYGGRKYRKYDHDWGRGAKQRLKRVGERLKDEGPISNYRRESYANVVVSTEKVQNKQRTVWVLYVRQ